MGPFASATSRRTCSWRVALAARRLIQSMEPCEPMLVMATFVPQDGLIHWTPARGTVVSKSALTGSTMASSWDLHAGDGSITLELPENFAADVDLHTGDGHISLDMPVTVEGRLGGNNIHGKLNGGGNLLTIHTGDGSIKLQKS